MADAIAALPPLREVIREYGLAADKRLGQHFLLDLNLTGKIAKQAGDLSNTHVIEVGPGPGGLTRAILMAGAKKLFAIEKDDRCLTALSPLLSAAAGRLELIEADALETDVIALAPEPRAIIANLPYNAGTPMLFQWLDLVHAHGQKSFTKLVLMFQKEVADRILAEPGSKTYGRLSITSQWLCECRRLFDLPASAFTPPPKVDSTIIELVPRAEVLYPADKKKLQLLVATAFQQRRKMLRASLKPLCADTEVKLKQAGIDPTLRPEDLSIAQFCTLANCL